MRETFIIEREGKPYNYTSIKHEKRRKDSRENERAVELSLANAWLEQVSKEVVEIGAVTPYYFPGKCKVVVDPTDGHSLVTHKRSVFDIDLTGKDVLSISTIEHIGKKQYKLPPKSGAAIMALVKILVETNRFLVTVPVGFNENLDNFLFFKSVRDLFAKHDCTFYHLVRKGDAWSPANPKKARLPYKGGGAGANAIIVLERGGLL